MPCGFLIELLAIKKCHILHIENLTSNKHFGHKLSKKYAD